MSEAAAPAAGSPAPAATAIEGAPTSTEAIDSIADQMLDGEESDTDDSSDSDSDSDEAKAEKAAKKESKKAAVDAKKAADAFKKKLKLKVNGKDVEEEIDFNDDARLTRALQKERAFDSASQELATMKKQFGGFLEALKGDQVMDVLKELGHDPDSLAEKHIERLVEQAKKSPEQIKNEAMETELSRLKKENADRTKKIEDQELESARNQMAAEIETDITSILDKTDTILPKRNPKIIRNIAANMLFAMQNGYPEVTAKEVIPLVESEYKRDLKELFDVLPEDTIELLVGKENLNRLRKKRMNNKKVQTQTANQIVKETGEKKAAEDDDKSKKKSYSKFFSYIE